MPVHEGFALRDGMVFLLTFFSIDASLCAEAKRRRNSVAHSAPFPFIVFCRFGPFGVTPLHSCPPNVVPNGRRALLRFGVIATRSEQQQLLAFRVPLRGITVFASDG